MTMSRQRPTHQASSRRTRARILATAAQSFAEHGYDGASINVIIETAEVTKGVFYLLFESKRGLANSVVHAMHAEWAPVVAAWAVRDVDALEQVQGLVADAVRLCAGVPLVRAGLRLCDEGVSPPEVGSPFQEWERILGHAFHRARRDNILCATADPVVAAHLVTVLLAGELRLARASERVEAVQVRVAAGLGVLLAGLATPAWLMGRGGRLARLG